MTVCSRSGFCLLLALLPWVAVRAQTVPLGPVVVTATRFELSSEVSPFATTALSSEALRNTPALSLDSALRSVPAFSLFRRSDSLTANPTAQGVSLRGLGPSGASRSLVVLDGIPLNDPFGGWIAWAKLSRESLAQVEIARGAGATAWGNAALGGVVQLISRVPTDESAGSVLLQMGDFETRGADWYVANALPLRTQGGATPRESFLEISGRLFSTEGYRTVAADDRGPIDTPAGTTDRAVSTRWTQAIDAVLKATVTARYFNEDRQNGTPYQTNSSEEYFVSAALEARVSPAFRWNAVAYGQDQTFASTFSAVSADRASETPASNQYDVPSEAVGAAWTGEWGTGTAAHWTAGADLRAVRGETRELFTYSNGQFTRRRVAGGRQATAGMFVLHERPLSRSLHAVTAVIGLRGDYWRETKGFRRETDLASGTSLRNDAYGDRSGWEFSPSAGLRGKFTERFGWRVSGQHAFRRPTLNELYRPFRVGNVITEANPGLGTERVTTGEVALTSVVGSFSSEVTAFWSELSGAVGNVTLVRGPGTFAGFGFVPAGGLGRRRENLDTVRVRGLELSSRWQATRSFAVKADALLNDAEVTEAAVAPGLVGKRVAQVPKTSASVGAEFRGNRGWRLNPRLRWIGAQFEDDENQLRLAPALVFDVSAGWRLRDRLELTLTIENVFNERIETGRSATNVVNVGTTRFATTGVRYAW
jgi:outer membrane receptor protein involved in Fe transport